MAITDAEALAARLEVAVEEAIAAIEGCSEERWTALVPADGWSFAATAHHIARALQQTFALARCIATGQPLPRLVPEEMEAANQEQARAFAACTKAETLALLRGNRDAALEQLRTLSDAQLARAEPFPILGGTFSARELIDALVIGHIKQHLANMLAPA